MNKLEELIRGHLQKARIIQVATSNSDQPWTCTVHFYADEKLNFYWFSRLDRRHSKEIAKNPKISIYILVHEDKPTEKYVIGISTEGTAQLVDTNDEIDNIKAYVAKFSISKSFLDDVISGKEPHKFYKFTPSNFVLFDNKNFPEQSRQEWTVET